MSKTFFAFLYERAYYTEAVEARDELVVRANARGYHRIRGTVGRVDSLRNRLCLDFIQRTEDPDDALIMLDTDHEHDPDTIERLLAWNVEVVGALAFRGSEPYDPQIYVNDPERPGTFRQPSNWTEGLLEVDAVGSAALCIRRSALQRLVDAGSQYPWFRFQYEDGLDLFSGEDLYFCDQFRNAGGQVYCDTSLVSPHLRVFAIDATPWLVSRGQMDAKDAPIMTPGVAKRSVEQRDLKQKWEALKDKHAGETCIVVGNGPSLKDIPLDFLQSFPTFGANRVYLHFPPTYFSIVNPLVLQQFGREVIEALKGKIHRFFLGEPWLWQRQEILMQPTVLPLRSVARKVFSDSPISGIYEGHTVTFVSLQLAYWMGFETVLLVGLDHEYETEGAPNELRESQGPDVNHFDPDYFGAGVQWHNPDLEKSEEAYRMARKAFESDGRKIVNVSTRTACDVFELGDWQDWKK